MRFNNEQLYRYSRQILLQEINASGQKKLINSKILIIGLGGLGSPAAFYLTAAGIGRLGIVDSDKVELSNLQRQILHFSTDIGILKTVSAKNKLTKLNPNTTVIPYNLRITDKNIRSIIKDYDFILDCTDNFETKFLINDICVEMSKPFSHAGVIGFQGQTMTFVPGKACYRCIFKSPPEDTASCAEAGILGTVAGIIGLVQATEAIKYILNTGKLLSNTILTFDALEFNFSKIKISKNPNCVCNNL